MRNMSMDACILKFAAVLSYVYWPWVHFISYLQFSTTWSGPFLEWDFFMSLCGPNLRNQQKSRIQQAKAEIFVSDNTLLCPPMFDASNLILQMKQLQTNRNDSDPVQVQWLWTCEKDHLCYDKPANIQIRLYDGVHAPPDSSWPLTTTIQPFLLILVGSNSPSGPWKNVTCLIFSFQTFHNLSKSNCCDMMSCLCIKPCSLVVFNISSKCSLIRSLAHLPVKSLDHILPRKFFYQVLVGGFHFVLGA